MEQVVVWRRPAKRGPHTPLVVLLHGRGADELDLIEVAGELPPAFAFASVRAPYALDEGGYNWYESRDGPAFPTARSLRTSIDGVRAWLDGPEVAPYNRERCYLFGFSAGMLMASALILDDPARFAGAILLSGAIAFEAGIDTPPGRLSGKPVFHGHGSLDDVIAQDRVVRTVRYLEEQSGAEVTDRTYPIGHAISLRELADIRTWLDERS